MNGHKYSILVSVYKVADDLHLIGKKRIPIEGAQDLEDAKWMATHCLSCNDPTLRLVGDLRTIREAKNA